MSTTQDPNSELLERVERMADLLIGSLNPSTQRTTETNPGTVAALLREAAAALREPRAPTDKEKRALEDAIIELYVHPTPSTRLEVERAWAALRGAPPETLTAEPPPTARPESPSPYDASIKRPLRR